MDHPAGVVEPRRRRAVCNWLTRDGDLVYAGQVRFGFAGKGLWSELDRLSAGPSRNGVMPIEPVLRANIKFFGRLRRRFIRDGVPLGLSSLASSLAPAVTWR